MELHFDVYQAFGDHVDLGTGGYTVRAAGWGRAESGTVYIALPFRSRGATVAALLRAVVARPVVIGNANLSAELQALYRALSTAGGEVQVDTQQVSMWPGRPGGRTCWRVPGDKIEALSHAGFAHDLALARACPLLDVIFSGHCHSPESGPITVGGVTVVKGLELAGGYATAQLDGHQWRAAVTAFIPLNALAAPPDGLRPILDQIAGLRRVLNKPVGALDDRFAGRAPSRRELLSHLARAAREMTGADVAVFNQTCLRETTLGPVLHVGELMTRGRRAVGLRPSADPGAASRAHSHGCHHRLPGAATHLDGRYPVTPYPALGDRSLHAREVLRDVLLAEVAGRC